jgi:hypothetical protein
VIGVAEVVSAVLIAVRACPPAAWALGSGLSGSARNSWGARTAGVHYHESRGLRPLLWRMNNVGCGVLAGAVLLLVPSGGGLSALGIGVGSSLLALCGTAQAFGPHVENR